MYMKKALKISLISLAVVVFVGAAALVLIIMLASTPLSPEQARQALEKELTALRRDHRLAGASLSIRDPRRGISMDLEPADSETTSFHTASAGKLFTTVLIARKIADGTILPSSSVAALLGSQTLSGLLHPADIALVTVEDLLSHTSGMADYFAGSTHDGTASIADQLVRNPERFWTVAELLEHSRSHQTPLRRGTWYYSDTGYLVLGLVAEALYGIPFTTLVHQELFDPLGMVDSYYPTRSQPARQPARPLRPTWLGNTNLAAAAALSADQAGGGVATTSADLQRFAQALADGRLLPEASLRWLAEARNRFETGIYYGRGMMSLRFGEFMPLLKGLPPMIGHMGILGTHIFIDPDSGTSIVINLGADGKMERSVRLLISALTVLPRIRQ